MILFTFNDQLVTPNLKVGCNALNDMTTAPHRLLLHTYSTLADVSSPDKLWLHIGG